MENEETYYRRLQRDQDVEILRRYADGLKPQKRSAFLRAARILEDLPIPGTVVLGVDSRKMDGLDSKGEESPDPEVTVTVEGEDVDF